MCVKTVNTRLLRPSWSPWCLRCSRVPTFSSHDSHQSAESRTSTPCGMITCRTADTTPQRHVNRPTRSPGLVAVPVPVPVLPLHSISGRGGTFGFTRNLSRVRSTIATNDACWRAGRRRAGVSGQSSSRRPRSDRRSRPVGFSWAARVLCAVRPSLSVVPIRRR